MNTQPKIPAVHRPKLLKNIATPINLVKNACKYTKCRYYPISTEMKIYPARSQAKHTK